jgi:cytidylate kinase
VLPDADLKVFLTASSDERARRRVDDLRDRGEEVDVEVVREQQARRDRQDTTRGASPLQVAPGSIVLDTTRLSPTEVVDRMIDELESGRDDRLDTSGEYPVRSRNHGS